MKKGYIPMVKYWIEDHYEQDDVVDFTVYTSISDAIKYLDEYCNKELESDEMISCIVKDGVNYIMVYDSYLSERYDDISKLWGNTGVGWYYAKEITIK